MGRKIQYFCIQSKEADLMGPLINLGKIDATSIMDVLYVIFHRDFVAQRTHLAGTIWIDPRSSRQEDGKESAFWHLTSRQNTYQKKEGNRFISVSERLPDFRRMERLEWVKLILDNHSDDRVRCFYHCENNPKNDIRLYLWAHQHDFVVILQKLGRSSSFLVTSFYVDHQRKREEYQRRFDSYKGENLAQLKGCEWF